MSKDHKQIVDQKIIELIRNVIKHDADLRDQYKIGHKFRFVTDRLAALLHQLEQHKNAQEVELGPKEYEAAPDEVIVYVHLFNVSGLKLANWQNMLNPSLFYEYSVNRPIYQDKKEIENFISKKTHRHQHAYITIAIKNADLLSQTTQDNLGNTILRVREGSLKFNKFIAFTHNNENYSIDDDGNIVRRV